MTPQKVIPALALVLCSPFFWSAQAQQDTTSSMSPRPLQNSNYTMDFDKTVVPITELKFLGVGMEGKFGTGFCLDTECRFIGTNYHVAVVAQPRKIGGERVAHLYLATGPTDKGATLNIIPSVGSLQYTPSRDLAIFELRHPIPNHHGIAFNLDDLAPGQGVEIYAYPKENIAPIRRLLQFHGTFKGETSNGLLAFDYSLSANRAIRPGASGGIVVDKKTQKILGILNEISTGEELIAVAVPIQSLADFVAKVQPNLMPRIFPPNNFVSAVLADMYSKFVPLPVGNALQHRPEESAEVKTLRTKAQLLADSIRDFIAVQTFEWGSGNRAPDVSSAYEVRVVDGRQRFRKYPDGEKELDEVPLPRLNGWVLPSDEWSKLPEMVGTDLKLKVRQAPAAIVNGRRMKVFQYYAGVEDNLCSLEPVEDFGFFTISKNVPVACFGEVWTDEDTNIIRVSEHLELSAKLKAYRGWEDYQVVLTYGQLEQANEPPRLTPVAIYTQAKNSKKVYWCRGQFTNYRVFGSSVKLLTN